MGLSQQDLGRVLDVVAPEALASPVGEMPHEVLRRLTDLIPSAGASFVVWDETKREILTCPISRKAVGPRSIAVDPVIVQSVDEVDAQVRNFTRGAPERPGVVGGR